MKVWVIERRLRHERRGAHENADWELFSYSFPEFPSENTEGAATERRNVLAGPNRTFEFRVAEYARTTL